MVMENKKEEREMIVEGGSQCQTKGKEQTGTGWPIADQRKKRSGWVWALCRADPLLHIRNRTGKGGVRGWRSKYGMSKYETQGEKHRLRCLIHTLINIIG